MSPAGRSSRPKTGAPIERELKLSVRRDFHLPDVTTVPGLSMVTQPEKTLVAHYYDTPDLDLARWGATLRYRGAGDTGEWTVKLEPPPPDRKRTSEPDPAAAGNPGDTGGTGAKAGRDAKGAAKGARTGKAAKPAGEADKHTGSAGAGEEGDGEATTDRYEIEFQAKPGRVPKAARDLTAGLRRGGALDVVAQLTTVRRAHLILDPDGTQLAELDDDTVEFTTAVEPARHGVFREIEVELLGDGSGDSKWTHSLYDLLAASGARRNDGAPKLMHALGHIPPRPRPVPRPKASATVAEVVSAAMESGLHRLLTHEPSLHLGAVPGPVHQSRVAVRRIAAQLQAIASQLDPAAAAALTAALEPLSESLGEVHTADRLEARLRAYRSRLDVAERTELDGLADTAHRQRTEAASRLSSLVTKDEHGRAIAAVFQVMLDPPLVSPDRLGAKVLLPILSARWATLRRGVSDLGDLGDSSVPVAELHTIRSHARQCRYAAVMAVPVLARAGGLAKAVADVQDILGEVQRASTAIEWLRETALAGSSSRALVAGRVISMETSRAAEARRRWEQVWNRTSDKRRTKWLAPSS